MNELKLENWYTIEELAQMCGYELATLKHGEKNLTAIMREMSINIDFNTRMGGYHNTQKFYSENVLKALKQYQIRNSAPNALKDKEAAITGNVSFVQSQTIAAILNDPKALLELAMQSSKKLLEVSAENEELKSTNKLLMHSAKTYTATEIAKELQFKSAIELNKVLEQKNIQFKRNGTWLPTAKYSNKGYYEIKQTLLDNGMVVYDSRITQSGREFILKLLA